MADRFGSLATPIAAPGRGIQRVMARAAEAAGGETGRVMDMGVPHSPAAARRRRQCGGNGPAVSRV